MPKNKPKYLLLLFLLLLKIELINAQDTFMEVGVGIGNVIGNKNQYFQLMFEKSQRGRHQPTIL